MLKYKNVKIQKFIHYLLLGIVRRRAGDPNYSMTGYVYKLTIGGPPPLWRAPLHELHQSLRRLPMYRADFQYRVSRFGGALGRSGEPPGARPRRLIIDL